MLLSICLRTSPSERGLYLLAAIGTFSVIQVRRNVLGVGHLVKPILPTLWTLVPALREFRVPNPGGRMGSCMVMSSLHQRRVTLSLVILLSDIGLLELHRHAGQRTTDRRFFGRTSVRASRVISNRGRHASMAASDDFLGHGKQNLPICVPCFAQALS